MPRDAEPTSAALGGGFGAPRADISTNLSASSGLWNDKALQFEISAAVRTQDKGGETGS